MLWLYDSFIQDLAMLNIDPCGWNDFGLILFNFLDKNNDGGVSKKEMKKAIRKIWRKCGESVVSGWKLWILRTDFFQETTLLATERKRKNIVIICVFICRNFCNSQSIAIQPLDFSQVLSKKRRTFLFWFWRK